MTWEEALTYDDIIRDVSREWARRYHDESLEEDIAHHVYMTLVQKVNTDHAIDKRAFVKTAAWRIALKAAKRYGSRQNHWPLEVMENEWGYQVDEFRQVRLPDYTVRLAYQEDDA